MTGVGWPQITSRWREWSSALQQARRERESHEIEAEPHTPWVGHHRHRDLGPELAAPPFEVAHERHEIVDALLWERVVDRRAHPAHRAVALEAVEPGLVDSLMNAFSRSSVARRNVTFIRDFGCRSRRRAPEAGAVHLRVQLRGLRSFIAGDRRQPAQPMSHSSTRPRTYTPNAGGVLYSEPFSAWTP